MNINDWYSIVENCEKKIIPACIVHDVLFRVNDEVVYTIHSDNISEDAIEKAGTLLKNKFPDENVSIMYTVDIKKLKNIVVPYVNGLINR
jgi:hypothetical protein